MFGVCAVCCVARLVFVCVFWLLSFVCFVCRVLLSVICHLLRVFLFVVRSSLFGVSRCFCLFDVVGCRSLVLFVVCCMCVLAFGVVCFFCCDSPLFGLVCWSSLSIVVCCVLVLLLVVCRLLMCVCCLFVVCCLLLCFC